MTNERPIHVPSAYEPGYCKARLVEPASIEPYRNLLSETGPWPGCPPGRAYRRPSREHPRSAPHRVFRPVRFYGGLAGTPATAEQGRDIGFHGTFGSPPVRSLRWCRGNPPTTNGRRRLESLLVSGGDSVKDTAGFRRHTKGPLPWWEGQLRWSRMR